MGDYFYYFDRFFSDSIGKRTYKYLKDNNNEILVVNVAGFTKSDIVLDVQNDGYKDYLYISAKPNEDMKDYIDELEMRFEIKSALVDEINYEVKDGLLLITVVRKDNKPKINIKAK
jgi:HSP20 family molecular chaperone IbpA